MDEGILYLIAAVVIIGIVIAIIAAMMYIGLILLAVVAGAGALWGVVVALKNFFQVLGEAHTAVPGPPGSNRLLQYGFAAVFTAVLVALLIGTLRLLLPALNVVGSGALGQQPQPSEAEEARSAKLIVRGDRVNFRAAPDTAASVVDRLERGAEVELVSERGDWFEVLSGGRRGWISKQYATLATAEPEGTNPGFLTPVTPKSVASYSISSDWRLLLEGRPISKPFLYADKTTPRAAHLSVPSPTGRYLFVDLCDTDWCDDQRILDLATGRVIARIASASQRYLILGMKEGGGSAAGVKPNCWSPGERFVVFGPYLIDMTSLRGTLIDTSGGHRAVEAEEGLPPDPASVRWISSTQFQLDKDVFQTIWSGPDSRGVKTGTPVRVRTDTFVIEAPSAGIVEVLRGESLAAIRPTTQPEATVAPTPPDVTSADGLVVTTSHVEESTYRGEEGADRRGDTGHDDSSGFSTESESGRRARYRDRTPEGTLVDHRGQLMWAETDNGSAVEWEEAASYCEDLELGGFTDWRLPSVDELLGIYERHRGGSSLHWREDVDQPRIGIHLSSCCPWSATRDNKDRNLFLSFASGRPGRVLIRSRDVRFLRALCVRTN